MNRIPKPDWNRVHELAVEIANASIQSDEVLAESKIEALQCVLKELATKYGSCSRIAATIADYSEEENRLSLYRDALALAKAEGDAENEKLILESMAELTDEGGA